MRRRSCRSWTPTKLPCSHKDVGAFVALYDQDVCVFDMWGEWSYNGTQAWREMVANWFGLLGTERVSVNVNDVRVVGAQDVAVVHAFITYRGLSAEGEALRLGSWSIPWSWEAGSASSRTKANRRRSS